MWAMLLRIPYGRGSACTNEYIGKEWVFAVDLAGIRWQSAGSIPPLC
jgi:hypothetical protein